MESEKREDEPLSAQTDRRAFLESAGKFAIGVPPALIVLLSTSMSSPAIAQSTGGGGQIVQPTRQAARKERKAARQVRRQRPQRPRIRDGQP
jgi:hypothetical protein